MVYSNITICIWGNFFTSSWIIITFNSIKIDSWTFAFFICWYQLKCSFKFVCIYFFINKNRWYSITFFFLFFFYFSPSPRIINPLNQSMAQIIHKIARLQKLTSNLYGQQVHPFLLHCWLDHKVKVVPAV